MEYPIEHTAKAIVHVVHEVGYRKCGLNYQQAVRAVTNALKELNEEQLRLNESQCKGTAA